MVSEMAITEKSIAVLVVALVVAAGVVPVQIMAQGANDSSTLLDTEREAIGTYEVDGARYTIYDTENVLPYASGIEVYRGGTEVTSRSQVKQVVRAVAWRRAASKMDDNELDSLRTINNQIETINNVVTPVIELLDVFLNVVADLKDRSILGTSAWDVITRVSPTMEKLEAAARELRAELQEWKNAADNVNDNVPAVTESISQVERGEDVNFEQRSKQLAMAMQGLNRLGSKSETVSDQLGTARDMSGTGASEVQSVPVVGSDLSSLLSQLRGRFGSASGNVAQFSRSLEDQRSELARFRSNANRNEQRLMDDWESRQSAQTKVYGTLGGGALVALSGLFVVGRRLR